MGLLDFLLAFKTVYDGFGSTIIYEFIVSRGWADLHRYLDN